VDRSSPRPNHLHCRSLNLEVRCPDPGVGPLELLNIGEMLMEPIRNGLVMPALDIPARVRDLVVDPALRLAGGMIHLDAPLGQ
jgi:hypothetical protein